MNNTKNDVVYDLWMQNKIYVVGYGTCAKLVTSDIQEAKRVLKQNKQKFPVLDWGIRTIGEALSAAYDEAMDQCAMDRAEESI